MEKRPVREAIGSLMYLANMTRPDISYAVNQISAFVSNPGYGHWDAIKRVLAFLAGTKNHGICFGGKNLIMRPLSLVSPMRTSHPTQKNGSLQQVSCFNSMEEESLGVASAKEQQQYPLLMQNFMQHLKGQETLYGSSPFYQN